MYEIQCNEEQPPLAVCVPVITQPGRGGAGRDPGLSLNAVGRSSSICFVPDTFLYAAPDILHRVCSVPHFAKGETEPQAKWLPQPQPARGRAGGNRLSTHIQLAVSALQASSDFIRPWVGGQDPGTQPALLESLKSP